MAILTIICQEIWKSIMPILTIKCFPNTAFFLKAAMIPNTLVDCHVVIKTARKGDVLIATRKADFVLKLRTSKQSSFNFKLIFELIQLIII